MSDKDRFFLYVLGGVVAMTTLWGVATLVIVLKIDPSDAALSRLIGVVATMFSACVGLATGYIMGRRNGQD